MVVSCIATRRWVKEPLLSRVHQNEGIPKQNLPLRVCRREL
jgi:hypothetical protein